MTGQTKKEIGTIEDADMEMKEVVAVIHQDKSITLEPKKQAQNKNLVSMLYELLPKQAEEVLRAVGVKIPIMLIDNIKDDTEIELHKALKSAGAIIVPPCIMEYKKENVSFLSIYLNVKR